MINVFTMSRLDETGSRSGRSHRHPRFHRRCAPVNERDANVPGARVSASHRASEFRDQRDSLAADPRDLAGTVDTADHEFLDA
ncbi:MAG: hypothetical protein E5X00_14725 [Mesorhizobium sp.]|nr:MAG: hypothetical protein E5X00_14725 [Mesorhizobium sp.]